MAGKLGRSVGKILLFFALWAAGISASTLAVLHWGGPYFYGEMGWRVALEAGGAASAFLALFVVARLIDKRPASTLGLPPRGALPGFLGGAAIGAAIFCVPMALLVALGDARFAPEFSNFTWPALGLSLLLVLVNTIDQELLVRSYLFQELWAKYSGAIAVAVSTLVFVGLHAVPISHGPTGLFVGLNILVASVMLGIAYLRSGALWLPIGIHFGWNALQGPLLGIEVTGADLGARWHAFALHGPVLWTGGTAGVEGGLAGLAGPLAGLILVAFLPRSAQGLKNTQSLLPVGSRR